MLNGQACFLRLALGLSVVLGNLVPLSAEESKAPVEIKASVEITTPRTPEFVLPEYRSSYRNGLYSTIVSYNAVKDFKLPRIQNFSLDVEGFKCPVPAHAIIQSEPAPLVVVLLGAEGRAADPLAKRWVSWMGDAGWNVLTFNSTLQKDFVSICGRGVSGYLEGEAEGVRDIIAAALKTHQFQGKVTRIGLVGMSYGGIQALLLARMGTEGKLTFTIDNVQAYSPPIDMMHSADLLDRWWREDRWKFTLPEIYFKVAKHKPVDPGCCIPLTDSFMRAGVAASFRLELVDIVEANDAEFSLNILPRADTANEKVRRRDYAATWGFTRFMRLASYPHWKEKLKLNDFSEFNASAKLCNIIPKLPATAEIIITDDDPLNSEYDFELLKKCSTPATVTFLAGGGHLGYTHEPWTQAKLMSLFKK